MKTKAKLLIIGMALLLVSGLALVGCSSGVSQDKYDAVVAKRDSCQTALTKAQGDLAAAQAQITTLQGNITSLQAEIATYKLTRVLAILSVVPASQAWSGNATNTTLLAAVTTAVNDSKEKVLKEKWDAFLAASAKGNPGFTLHQFYGYMLGETSPVASLFPASVQPLMGVGDEMAALVGALSISLLGKMTDAVNASGNQELISRWNAIVSTFGTNLPQAMKLMLDMQVWLLGQIAAAAPKG